MSVTLCETLSSEEKIVVDQILVERRLLIHGIATLETLVDASNVLKSDKYTPERAMQIGRKKFNINPKKGMEFLFQHQVVNETADDVAKFLRETEGLSKVAIGEYIGKFSEFNLAVLDKFVELLDFTSLDFLEALRKFLKPFVLPGEGQVISRFMEKFATKFKINCPQSPVTVDGAFILAYSTIMLNTDLHNPLNKNKMTMDAFIKNNRGINDGEDLPKETLIAMYTSIRDEEFEYPKAEDGPDLKDLFFNPEREGWLIKQGGRNKNWRKRWCIITGNCLYYFKHKPASSSTGVASSGAAEEAPLGIVPLEALSVRTLKKGKCQFEIYSPDSEAVGIKSCKTKGDGTVVEGHHMTFVLMADNADEQADWVRSLKASMTNDPCYAMFRQRREGSGGTLSRAVSIVDAAATRPQTQTTEDDESTATT